MKKSVLILFSAVLLAPALSFAQDFHTGYLDQIVIAGTGWLNTSITVIMVLMTLWFLIGVFRYIAEKDPGKLADKRKVMLNGLIGLFVAVSVWGIIRIAGNIVGTTGNNSPVNIVCPPGMRPGTGSTAGTCVPGI